MDIVGRVLSIFNTMCYANVTQLPRSSSRMYIKIVRRVSRD